MFWWGVVQYERTEISNNNYFYNITPIHFEYQ